MIDTASSLSQSDRLEIAHSIIPDQFLSGSVLKAFKSEYRNINDALRGIYETRKKLIPTFENGISLDSAPDTGEANCIGSSLLGCAIAFLVKDPVVEPIFIFRSKNASMALADCNRADKSEVFHIGFSNGVGDKAIPASPYTASIFNLHRQPGSRMFTVPHVDEGTRRQTMEAEALPPFIAAGALRKVTAWARLIKDDELYSELGFLVDNGLDENATLSIGGRALIDLDIAVKEWYALKTAVGGVQAARCMSSRQKMALPFRV